jgi:hypothetical protein
VPVTLVLQQLDINLSGIRHNGIYAPSYELEPNAGVNLPTCEVDLVMIIPRIYPDKAEVILGECKDEGGRIDADDIENLRRVADALPKDRFETYILLAKLAPFTPDEIALARSLNGPYQQRVILLTARELEPHHIYERTKAELGIDSYGGTPEELARVTRELRLKFQTATRIRSLMCAASAYAKRRCVALAGQWSSESANTRMPRGKRMPVTLDGSCQSSLALHQTKRKRGPWKRRTTRAGLPLEPTRRRP